MVEPAITERDLEWAEDHSTMGFIENVRQFPVIAMVTQGFMGSDWAMNTFSADEVMWICDIQKQTRIIMRDEENHHISVPLNYKVPFQKIINGRVKKPSPLSAIVTEWQKTMFNFKVMLEDNALVTFNEGSFNDPEARFGELELKQAYEERYLVGYPICRGEVDGETPLPVPVYVNIRLAVAERVQGGTVEDLHHFMFNIDWQLRENKNTKHNIDFYKEILLLGTNIGEGNYDYITPMLYSDYATSKYNFDREKEIQATLKLQKPKVNKTELPTVSGPPPPLPPKTFASQIVKTQSVEKDDSSSGSDYEKIDFEDEKPDLPSRHTAPLKKAKSVKHRRPPPKPKSENDTGTKSMKLGKKLLASLSVKKKRTQSKSEHSEDNVHEQSAFNGEPNRSNESQSHGEDSPTPKPPEIGNNSGYIKADRPETTDANNYAVLNHIPSDISSLSVDNICMVLSKIHLDKHVEGFREDGIDGQKLMSMTIDEMKWEYCLTTFEAKNLYQFVHDNWRPKL